MLFFPDHQENAPTLTDSPGQWNRVGNMHSLVTKVSQTSCEFCAVTDRHEHKNKRD